MSLSLTPSSFSIGQIYNRRYRQLIQLGLVGCVWFSAFEGAAYDLWAACAVFSGITFLVLLLVVGHYRTNRNIRLPCLGPIVSFIGALVISTIYSFDYASSRLETWIWIFSFMSFFLLVNSVDSTVELRWFFAMAGAVMIPLAIFCIFEQTTGSPKGYGQINFLGTSFEYGHWEIHATLINSIVMCGFALYWFFVGWERTSEDAIKYISLAAFFTVLLLGRSLWACISLGFGLLFYNRHIIKRNLLKSKMPSIALISLFALTFTCALLFKLGRNQGIHYSGSNRFYWWLAALKMAYHHPISGIGAGAFGIAYPYFRTIGIRNTLFAHSFVLQFLSETGFLGLLALFWLSVSVYRRITAADDLERSLAPSKNALLSTLVVILSYSLINISLEYFLNKLMLLIVIASFAIEDNNEFNVRSGLPSVAIALSMVLLTPLWIAPLQASRILMNGIDNEEKGNWVVARDYFRDAITVDPKSAEPYVAMARTYRHAYLQTHSESDLNEWHRNLSTAFRWKKDIRYNLDLSHPPSQ